MPLSYGTIVNDTKNGIDVAKKETPKRHSGGYVYFAGIVASLSMAAMGLSAGYTSSSSTSMMDSRNTIKITIDEITWIASIVQLSAVLGGSVSGYLSKKFGRKSVLMYNSVPFMVSWLMVVYSSNIPWIYAGRFLTGFCSGVATVNVPAYLTEISKPSNRGRLGSLFNLSIAIGAFMATGLGIIITWRWVALCGAVTVTLNMLMLYFIPESPHWLAANGRKTEALEALKFLRGSWETANLDYDKICDSLVCRNTELSVSEFMKPAIYKPILISFVLIFVQQFCGINPLMAYSVQIFSDAGSSLNPDYAAIIVAIIQIMCTALSSFVIDKFSRRTYFTFSGIFVSTGLMILSVFIYCSSDDKEFSSKFGWMPILGYVVFLLAYSLGYGPIPFIQTSEMVPLHFRSAAVAIATMCMYLFSFIVTKTFDDLEDNLDTFGVFALYAGIALFGVVFARFFQPETKGKSLLEIEQSFHPRDPKQYKSLPDIINDP